MIASFNMPSPQGITSSMEAEKKSKEIGVAEKPLECMVGGHRISPVEEGRVLEIKSTRQGSGTTEATERTLFHCGVIGQKKTPKVASVMPVDGGYSEQLLLPRELEIIGEPRDLLLIAEKECEDKERRKFFESINKIYELKHVGKLKEAGNQIKTLRGYIESHSDDNVIINRFHQCVAYLLYASNNIRGALDNFARAEKRSEGPVNFPENLFIMHLMLGMGGDGKSRIFQVNDFYEAIKKWVGADVAEDEKIEQLLEEGFGQNASHIKIFRDGIKAVFGKKGVNAKESEVQFKESIAKLTKLKEDQSIPVILKYLVPILNFARNLELTKQGRPYEAAGNSWVDYLGTTESFDNNTQRRSRMIMRPSECMLPHLNEYLIAIGAKTLSLGWNNVAVERMRECVNKGYPFSDQLVEKFMKLDL